jgi:hypothetical protein
MPCHPPLPHPATAPAASSVHRQPGALNFPPQKKLNSQVPLSYLSRSKPAAYTLLGRRLVVW